MRQIKARAKWVKSAPRKIQRMVDVVRGMSASEALVQLKFMPHKAARILEKVIKSAVANAKHNYKMDEAKMIIQEAFVNKGIVMKRFQPRARGRAFPIKKRTSHVTVSLISSEEA
jgi:large subunit ribosomal protein L22